MQEDGGETRPHVYAEEVRRAQLGSGAYGPLPLTRDLDLDDDALVEQCRGRLRTLRQHESIRRISDRTGVNHETVRRYLSNAEPGLRFVIMATRAYGLSAEWVLFGTGPLYLTELPDAVRSAQSDAELIRVFSRRLGHLVAKVEGLSPVGE